MLDAWHATSAHFLCSLLLLWSLQNLILVLMSPKSPSLISLAVLWTLSTMFTSSPGEPCFQTVEIMLAFLRGKKKKKGKYTFLFRT